MAWRGKVKPGFARTLRRGVSAFTLLRQDAPSLVKGRIQPSLQRSYGGPDGHGYGGFRSDPPPRTFGAGSFTLIELLVVTAIVGVVVVVIAACLTGGIRVWDRAQTFLVIESDAVIGLRQAAQLDVGAGEDAAGREHDQAFHRGPHASK